MPVHQHQVLNNNFSIINTATRHDYSLVVSRLNQAIHDDDFLSLTCTLKENPTFDLLETMGEKVPPLHFAARSGSNVFIRFFLTQTTIHPDVYRATPQMEHSVVSVAMCRKDPSIVQLFIDAGADVNEANYQAGTTPLMIAASLGCLESIAILCDANADLERVDCRNHSALDHAIARGNDTAVRALLERGALLDGRKPAGTSVCLAIFHGQTTVLKTLLDIDKNANREKNLVGTTPLMFAAGKRNSVEMIHILLDAGANIEAKDRRGYNALMAAAEMGDANMIRALCAYRIKLDVNATSHHQMMPLLPRNIPSVYINVGMMRINPHQTTFWHSATALMIAVHHNHLDAVQALIDAGARVNARDDQAKSVLMYAAKAASPEIISTLCNRGAKTELTFGNGTLALEYAVIRGDVDVVQALIAAKANVNAVIDDARTTILMAAVERRSIAMLSVLVNAGARIDAENYSDTTALTLAIGHKKPAFVKELLALGANPNGCREAKKIPLILAAVGGHNDIIGMLLEGGADVDALDINQNSALILAVTTNHPSTVTYLLASGADRTLRNAVGLNAFDYARALNFHECLDILENSFKKRPRMAMN